MMTADRIQEFESLRARLFAIAYRMLGRVSDAEDVVQETFLRYQRALHQGAEIESTRAFLSTIVTRLSINELQSARARRERYVGEWLPEPVLTEQTNLDGARYIEESDSLSMAFLLVLERLSPVERAVFLLHDIFDYGYDEVSGIVGKSEGNCRQLATRARRHVREEKPRFEASRKQREELAARFFDALGNGDLENLVDMLAADVAAYSDGGGKAPSWQRPIFGRARVVQLLAGLRDAWRDLGWRIHRTEINGQPGLMLFDRSDLLVATWTLQIADGVVQAVRAVINPDKLRHLAPVADAAALARELGEHRSSHQQGVHYPARVG